jgi:YD repeat-containing protein
MVSVDGTTELTNNYQYNPDGDITQVTQSGSALSNKEVTFAYNSLGQLTTVNAFASTNGTSPIYSAAYGYNSAEQLTSLGYTNSGDSSIDSFGYTYNANGQITQETSIDGTANYACDNDGQLTGASGSALPSSGSYSYDANGNRTNTGDTTAAILSSLTSTCKRQGIDPQHYLTQLLTNLPETPMSEITRWLPDEWKRRNLAASG